MATEIPFPEPISKEKVLGWWPFHRTEADNNMATVGFGGGNLNNQADFEWRKTQNTVGGAMLENTGQGYIETHGCGEFGSNTSNNFAVAFTFQFENATDTQRFMASEQSNNSQFLISSGDQGALGGIDVWLSDQDNSHLNVYTEDSSFSDGNHHRAIVNKEGNTSGDINIWVDGQQITTSSAYDQGFSNPSNFDNPLMFFVAIDGSGNVRQRYGGILEDIVIYGDSLSQTEIQNDWERQPWRNNGTIYVIPESAIARWQFNDDSDTSTATDSWSDNDGSITGATYTTTSQEGSHALSFNGSGDIVTVPQTYRGSTALTIFTWFQMSDYSGSPKLIFGDGQVALRSNQEFQNTDLSALIFDGSGGETRTKISTSLSANTWYFAAVSAGPTNGQLLRVYDTTGLIEEVTASRSNDVGSPDRDAGIGGRSDNTGYMPGIIDDMRVDGQEYTASEMDEIYNSY